MKGLNLMGKELLIDIIIALSLPAVSFGIVWVSLEYSDYKERQREKNKHD